MTQAMMVERLTRLINKDYVSIDQAMETVIEIDQELGGSLPIEELFGAFIDDEEGEWITSVDPYGTKFYLIHDDIERMCHQLIEEINAK